MRTESNNHLFCSFKRAVIRACRINQGNIYPCFLALAFARSWLTLTYSAPSPAFPVLSLVQYGIFDYSYCLTALIMAFLAHRISPIYASILVKVLALIGMVCASLLCLAGEFHPIWANGFATIGSVFGGIGFSLMLLLWSETVSTLSLRQILIQMAASQIIAVVILFFCQDFGTLRMSIVIIILPFAAFASIMKACCTLALSVTHRTYLRLSFPWKLTVLLAVYSFAYGVRQQNLITSEAIYTFLAMILVMSFFFVGLRFFSDKLSINALYRSPFLFMMCGFLLIPLEGFLSTSISSFLIATSYVLMTTLISLLLYDTSKRLGTSIVFLFGIKNAIQIFVVWGNDVRNEVAYSNIPNSIQEWILCAAVVLVVAIASTILLSETELVSKWGSSLQSVSSLRDEDRSSQILIERCNTLSQKYHLSPREDEILRLIAQGSSYASIAKELFIAKGTLKTHTHHIYEKVGVRTRQELISLFNI